MTNVTATTPGVFDMANVSCVWERAELSGREIRAAYDWTVKLWSRLGIPPENASLKGGGVPPSRSKRNFTRFRKQLEGSDFDDLSYVGLDRMLPEWTSPGQQAAQFYITRNPDRSARYTSFQSLFPPAVGVSDEDCERHLLEFASMTRGRYGYIFYKKWNSSFWYATGVLAQTFEDPATEEEESANISRWQADVAAQERCLRDLYPINLLSDHYLDLPFGSERCSLREWIQASADRGSLMRLAGAPSITVWRPVVENIPQLRTQLFIGGLLFYWRHFDPSQAEFRDFSKPFAPPEAIPAIFRPEFYSSRDPRVTR